MDALLEMIGPLMWLLAIFVILSSIAILLTIKIRQRRYRDNEFAAPAEKTPSYRDHDPVSAPFYDILKPKTAGLSPSIVRSDIGRVAWVLRMTRHVFTDRHEGRYNVVVINDDLEYRFQPEAVVEKFLIKFHISKRPWIVPYSVVVFDRGTLLNLGDGGDINWDWQGNFTRSGNKRLTFEPCISGVQYKQDPWNAL